MTTPLFPPVPPAAVERANTDRTFLTTVLVNGTSIGEFDSFDGGDVSAEVTKYAPGSSPGMKVAMGGPTDTDDFTVARFFSRGRDHELARQLDAVVGTAQIVASRQPLGDDRMPFGKPRLYAGVLQKVAYPKHDSGSNTTAQLTLTVVADGLPG